MTAKSADPNRVEIIRHYFSRTRPLDGGVCVYATHTKGDSFIRVNTAICAVGDQYSKKTGALWASPNFLANGITLPIRPYFHKDKLTRDNLLWHVEHYFGETLGERYLDGIFDN